MIARRNDLAGEAISIGDILPMALNTGNPLRSLELVSPDMLAREDVSLSNLVRDTGLVKYVVAPVRVDGNVVGALVGGILISTDPWIGDLVYGRFGVEMALFAGNPREPMYLHSTTSLPRSTWMLGQLLPKQAQREIELGRAYTGLLEVDNQQIMTAFEPLKDSRQRIIGAIGISTLSTPIDHTVFSLLSKGVAVTAIIGLLVALISTFFVHHDITRPLSMLTQTMRRFGRGELETRVNLKTGDQLEELGIGFNAMAEGIRRREERFKKHNEVARLFMSTMDMDALLNETLRIVVSVTQSRLGILYLLDDDGAMLVPHAHYGTTHTIEPLAMGSGIPGRVAMDRIAVTINPAADEQPQMQVDMGFMQAIPREVVYLPLVYKENVLGVLVLGSAEGYDEDERQLFDYLTDHISIALDNARMHQRLHELSVTDGLTGLHNRRFLNNRLEQEWARCQRQGTPISILLSDIDNFKSINDEYGHDKGDLVLQDIARIFKAGVRKEDIVARYGGEEFVVLLVNTDKDQAIQMAERIGEMARNNVYPWMGRAATMSIGVASYPDVAADNYEALVQAADQAMYQAKGTGKDKVVAR